MKTNRITGKCCSLANGCRSNRAQPVTVVGYTNKHSFSLHRNEQYLFDGIDIFSIVKAPEAST